MFTLSAMFHRGQLFLGIKNKNQELKITEITLDLQRTWILLQGDLGEFTIEGWTYHNCVMEMSLFESILGWKFFFINSGIFENKVSPYKIFTSLLVQRKKKTGKNTTGRKVSFFFLIKREWN